MKPLQKILIVDDSAEDRVLFRRVLEKANIMAQEGIVLEAADAKSGYEVSQQERPDCIILDFMMFGKDGFQLLAELRSESPFVPPIIFTTGMHSRFIQEDALALGAQYYLNKDELSVESLQAAVDHVMKGK